MNRLGDRVGVAIAGAVVLLISLIFGGLAYWLQDPHYLNRGGATILMVAALSVVWQVTRERSTEARVHSHNETAREGEAVLASTPSVVRRMTAESGAVAKAELSAVRSLYVWFVALVTAYGEFLHGWGDLIMKGLGVHGGK